MNEWTLFDPESSFSQSVKIFFLDHTNHLTAFIIVKTMKSFIISFFQYWAYCMIIVVLGIIRKSRKYEISGFQVLIYGLLCLHVRLWGYFISWCYWLSGISTHGKYYRFHCWLLGTNVWVYEDFFILPFSL